MKEHSILKKLTAILLTALLVVTGTGIASNRVLAEDDSVEVTFEQIENEGNGRLFATKKEAAKTETTVEPEAIGGKVRVSIVLEDRSTISAGYSTENIASNASAKQYRAELKAKQDALAKTISQEILNGEELDVVWNITLAGNIISANVPFDAIDKIKKIIGVEDVVIETKYSPDVVSTNEDDPNMGTATEMVGGNYAWAAGYTGAGSKVAIIDTGLDTDHELFDAEAFDYAIAEDIAAGKTVELLDADDVAAVWDQLNASKFLGSVNGVYRTTKNPYGVNYVDKGLDITHDNDTQGEHGSHVTGIAAANRYVKNSEGEFVQSLYQEGIFTQGEAPDAQILTMKVFGRGGGAYDSDYMVAIEDAIILGADSVNLSLGSANAGQVTNATYQNILDELTTSATIATMSAGNNYYWTEPAPYQTSLYDDDVNYATGGSPGSYPASFASASIDNKGGTGNYFRVGDRNYIFNDGSSASNRPMVTIAGEYEYIFLEGPGVDDNNNVGRAGDTFFALGQEVVGGKVAFCSRGSSSFFAKANAAIGAGAIATVIYNNQEGTISMNMTGYTGTAPAVSITQADGQAIKNASTKVTTADGITYYTGTIIVSDQVGVANPGEVEYYVMSDFSSWGVPSDLSLKPEITTPGGNIWSVNGAVAGGKGYENMSGTSMASPQTAGLIAVFNQYARETGLPEKTGKTLRQLALSMLMSTAKPVYHETKGLYPLMKQGSGLADVNAAINAKSYITIDSVAEAAPLSAAKSVADGKVKIELGEVQDDSFSTTFTLHNFSEEDVEYYLSADFFTQQVSGGFRQLLIEPVDTLGLAWTINGEAFEPADATDYDFNGDGVANGVDAQYLLEWIVELHEEINNEDKADIDEDGDIDTYDARLAFEMLSNAGVVVEAGNDATVTLTVSGLDNAFGSYTNGNYIEAYIYAKEGETEDGALGVTHSIPLLGFYGNWTDASMYDKMNYIDYYYEYETRLPYLGTVLNAFLIQYPGDSGKYYFGGNPIEFDEEYMPERNAMNSESVISDVEYVQIRNAAGSRFTVNKGTTPIYTQIGGAALGAYYYRNQAQWRNTSASAALGYSPTGMKDGSALELKYELAPEYYVEADGSIRWDDLGDGAALTMPFVVDNTAPYIVDVSVDENALTVLAHDNEYIAAVALYLENGTMVDYYGGVADIRRGEQHSYEFDLSNFEQIPPHFLVEVYDYANNLTSYKLNLNPEELDEGLSALKISPESALIMKGATQKFTVTAEPWGANEDVSWVSDDTTVATVDVNGIVTGVGKGTTTIRAISDEKPEVFAEATVTVKAVEATVFGGVQGADGKPVFYGWDLETDPTYSAIAPLEHDITAMAYDWLNDDGEFFYQQDWEGYLYKVSANSMTAVGQSPASTAFGAPMEDIDIPFVANMMNGTDEIFGVYSGYLLYTPDYESNTFNSGYNLATYLRRYTRASMLVALAWGGADLDTGTDYLYALDNAGYLWEFDYDGENLSFGYLPTTLSMDYPQMDVTRGNSLLLGDDGNFYLAHYNGSTSEIYQLVYEDGTFVAYRAGDFGQDVWPATVIMAAPNESGDDSGAIRPAPAFSSDFEMVATDVKAEYFGPAAEETAVAPEGGLDSVKKDDDSAADTDKTQTTVIIQIVADELSKNGLITVDVPETAYLLTWASPAEHRAWNDKETGRYVFGFVDLEGFELNEAILTLMFSKESTGTVTITTTDINDDDEQVLTETVILGPATAEHKVHNFGAPVWNWDIDYESASATATFTCDFEGYQEVVEAEIEAEETVMSITYTATVVFQGETYTNVRTVNTKGKDLVRQLLLYYVNYRNANGYESAYTSEADYDIDRIIADLKEADPYLGDSWEQAIRYWDDALYPFNNGYSVNGGTLEEPYGEVPDGLPEDDSLAIVCLGFQLDQTTGEMQPELIGRLQVALNAWQKYPNAYIAVTGGGTAAQSAHPENTEGGEMKKWLLEQGVPEEKIICEDQAKNTYGNAANTYKILAADYPQVTSVVMVSSTYHVPRGSVLFQIQFLQTAAENGEECRVHIVDNAGYYVDKPNYASTGGFESFMMFSMQVPSIPGVSLRGVPTPALSAAADPLEVVLASPIVEQGEDLEITDACFKVVIGDDFNEDYYEPAEISEITCDYDPTVVGEQLVTFCYTWKPGTAYEKTVTGQVRVTVEEKKADVYRLTGEDRFETAIKAASEYRDVLGIEQFDAVILANAWNFPDALSGSYLSAKKTAPVLLIDKANAAKVSEYVTENLKSDGTVYVLGGTSAVEDEWLEDLANFNIVRLAGKDRYLTNLAILEEAGVAGEDILVCAGGTFADSLSAGATGKPILLVGPYLTKDQKTFLSEHSDSNVYIIGGTAAVPASIEDELGNLANVVGRLAGADRYETSVLIAEEFFDAPEKVVLAYAWNFPDGLSAGPLGFVLDAPVLLVDGKNYSVAEDYCATNEIVKGYIVGSDNLVTDAAGVAVFSLASADEIVTK